MNVGLVTIAALLLLLPGVGFIVGVSFADKNVREIVFRNTPAEIGYVLVISLVVHLLFALASLACLKLADFNTAHLYLEYLRISKLSTNVKPEDALWFLTLSLSYYLAATVAGFLPGYGLGLLIRRRLENFVGRIVSNFVKHRWMLQLIQSRQEPAVYASVLLKDTFAHIGKVGRVMPEKPTNRTDYRVVVQGTIKDCYFASDGTLLYIVFDSYSVLRADGATTKALNGVNIPFTSDDDQLVIEGKNIELVRYSRTSVPTRMIEAALEQAPSA